MRGHCSCAFTGPSSVSVPVHELVKDMRRFRDLARPAGATMEDSTRLTVGFPTAFLTPQNSVCSAELAPTIRTHCKRLPAGVFFAFALALVDAATAVVFFAFALVRPDALAGGDALFGGGGLGPCILFTHYFRL